MAATSSEAEKIVDGILSSNDKILASDGAGYGATLAIATLNVVNEVKDIFGEAQAIITIHDDCKLTLVSMPS
jgi:hypothetical protein